MTKDSPSERLGSFCMSLFSLQPFIYPADIWKVDSLSANIYILNLAFWGNFFSWCWLGEGQKNKCSKSSEGYAGIFFGRMTDPNTNRRMLKTDLSVENSLCFTGSNWFITEKSILKNALWILGENKVCLLVWCLLVAPMETLLSSLYHMDGRNNNCSRHITNKVSQDKNLKMYHDPLRMVTYF